MARPRDGVDTPLQRSKKWRAFFSSKGLPADLASLSHGDLVLALRRMAAAHDSEVATLRKEKATLVAAVKAARARDAAARVI